MRINVIENDVDSEEPLNFTYITEIVPRRGELLKYNDMILLVKEVRYDIEYNYIEKINIYVELDRGL